MRRSEALGTGTYTYDLECGPGQVAIAPSWEMHGGPARLRSSFRNGQTGWRFVIDSTGGTTADLAIRCLDETTGETNGHAHRLALAQHSRTITVPAGGDMKQVRIECGADGKGIVASYDLDKGLKTLGNEPQPVNRDFRITNPTDAPLDARLGLLCLGDRTSSPPTIDEYVNTASVSSTTPDPDADDRIASARVTRSGSTAPPAPVAPAPAPAPDAGAAPDPTPSGPTPAPSAPGAAADEGSASAGPATLKKSTLSFEVSCTADCSGTATVVMPKKLRSGKVKLDPGDILGEADFDLAAGRSALLEVQLGKKTAKALRKAKLSSLIVELREPGTGVRSGDVALSFR